MLKQTAVDTRFSQSCMNNFYLLLLCSRRGPKISARDRDGTQEKRAELMFLLPEKHLTYDSHTCLNSYYLSIPPLMQHSSPAISQLQTRMFNPFCSRAPPTNMKKRFHKRPTWMGCEWPTTPVSESQAWQKPALSDTLHTDIHSKDDCACVLGHLFLHLILQWKKT